VLKIVNSPSSIDLLYYFLQRL